MKSGIPAFPRPEAGENPQRRRGGMVVDSPGASGEACVGRTDLQPVPVPRYTPGMRAPACFLRFLSAILVCPILPAHSAESIQDRLKAETERIAAELAEGSRLVPPGLPPEEGEQEPPRLIQSAGEDFVRAWRSWNTVSLPSPRRAISPAAPPEKRINVHEDSPPFYDLLTRTIEAEPPPKPEEYARFIYNGFDGCANGVMHFEWLSERGHTLSLLRSGEHFDALKQLSGQPGFARDNLLRAYGIDPEEFEIGRWLHKLCMPDGLCRQGGEKTAAMLLKWAKLRWDAEFARIEEARKTRFHPGHDEPYFPRLDLILLLRPDNGVTDETKGKIARFIETKGLEMFPLADWIRSTPRGSEKWMVSLARQGLGHELNEVRTRSSRILTAAGIEHSAPELRPAPQFRITVNGKPWPGDTGLTGWEARPPGMSFDYGEPGHEGGVAFGVEKVEEGLFTVDSDRFFEEKHIRNAKVYRMPPSGMFPTSASSPWLRASVSLPVKPGAIHEINIETIQMTIKPVLPKARTGDGNVMEIEFDRADGENVSDGSLYRYHADETGKLVLPHVSPGDYWLRVRHPGTSLMPMTRVTIDRKRHLLEPKLKPGSTLVVPVAWPGGKMPKELPTNLARIFARGDGERSAYRWWFELRRQGKKFEAFGPIPESARGRYPRSAVFANLPPGKYEVHVPAQTWEAQDGDPAYSIRHTFVEITIDDDSPTFIEAPALRIDLSSP